MTEALASLDDLPYLDMEGEEYLSDPFGVLDATREKAWAARTNMGIILLSYNATQSLIGDSRLRQPGIVTFQLQGVTEGTAYDFWENSLLNLPRDEHVRIRSMLSKTFHARNIAANEAQVERTIHRLIDRFPVGERFEFVESYADPLPIIMVCQLFGIPESDHGLFGAWTHDINLLLMGRLQEFLPQIEAALDNLYAYIEDLVAERRNNLGDDTLSRLLRGDGDGSGLTLAELKYLIVTLVLGGQDTTRFQLAWVMVEFLKRPELWSQLRENPDQAAHAAEELLRYRPGVMENFRLTNEDVVWENTLIPANTFISVSAAAANWDAACTANGSEFRPDRAPTNHLAFGKGAHFCLGQAVARQELIASLRILPQRMPIIRAEGPVEWSIPRAIAGPSRVPMSYRMS